MRAWFYKKIVNYLLQPSPRANIRPHLCDFSRICHEIIPGDVLLVEGQSRISQIIKHTTSSHWTHVSLYIGRLHSIESATSRSLVRNIHKWAPSTQLLLEISPGHGVEIKPISHHQKKHIRICRPIGLSFEDAQKIIDYCLQHLGKKYNNKHFIQLGRFLFYQRFMPLIFKKPLFQYKKYKESARVICSSLIAEAFVSVNFPILPLIEIKDGDTMKMTHRNPKLFIPSDFDYSPYFSIIKYPIFPGQGSAPYHQLPWQEGQISNDGYISEVDTSHKNKKEKQED